MSASRRLVNVFVTPDIVTGLLFPSRPGVWQRTDTGLPDGAECVGKNYDYNCGHDRFVFTFSHPSFPEVPEGSPVPTFHTFSVTAFHFDSPATDKAIADLNTLTAKQIEVAERIVLQAYDTHKDGREVMPRWSNEQLTEKPDWVMETEELAIREGKK